MKRSIQKITLVLAFLLCTAGLNAQSGWIEKQWYESQGGSDRTCGPVVSVLKTNGPNYWYEGWQTCRDRNWYQEYHSGYVYLWGPNGWYTEWQEGYFWAFNWYDFEVRAW
jgi:hypothetical protein